jgi:hypothetical protein
MAGKIFRKDRIIFWQSIADYVTIASVGQKPGDT